MKLIKVSIIALVLSLSNVAFAGGDVNKVIAKAESTLKQASKSGFEWTTTAKLIDGAKKAAKGGDSKLAMKLAKKALKEGENSLIQAKYSEMHWQDYAPK